MKKTYSVYYYADEENKTLHIEIPRLRLTADGKLTKDTRKARRELAREYIEDELYLYEYEGKTIPEYPDEEATPGWDYSEEIEIETAELTETRQVIWGVKF